MKKAIGMFAAVLMMGQAAFAANVFVKDAQGDNLSQRDIDAVTNLVRQAVMTMPDDELVRSQDMADFMLQPVVVQDGDRTLLRIEKVLDGQVVSTKERVISEGDGASQAIAATRDAVTDEDGSMSGTTQSANETEENMNTAGESRGVLSAIGNEKGLITLSAGPSFGLGLDSDNVMLGIGAGYNHMLNEQWTIRGFGTLNLGLGADASRFINLGVGGVFFPTMERFAMNGRPYIEGNLGYGFARSGEDALGRDVTEDAPTLGLVGGYLFEALNTQMDVNLAYTIMTDDINGDVPSVIALRAGVQF